MDWWEMGEHCSRAASDVIHTDINWIELQVEDDENSPVFYESHRDSLTTLTDDKVRL